jgi:hypothetical protein
MREINLIGKTFGKLTVISKSFTKKSRIYWKCKCQCGNEKDIDGGHLRSGHTNSCGCSWYQYGEKHHSWKGYNDISKSCFKNIKFNAKNRGIPFKLKIEELWDLFVKQNRKCALSGIPLVFEAHHGKIQGNVSLDRIDSSKGYIIDNVQWVHKDINYMKQEYSMNHFLELCQKICDFQNQK